MPKETQTVAGNISMMAVEDGENDDAGQAVSVSRRSPQAAREIRNLPVVSEVVLGMATSCNVVQLGHNSKGVGTQEQDYATVENGQSEELQRPMKSLQDKDVVHLSALLSIFITRESSAWQSADGGRLSLTKHESIGGDRKSYDAFERFRQKYQRFLNRKVLSEYPEM